jgi:predicted amidohydrolase
MTSSYYAPRASGWPVDEIISTDVGLPGDPRDILASASDSSARIVASHTMKIAACQPPDVQNDTERALSLIESHTANAHRQGAKVVCFPECFLQGYDVRAEYVANAALDLESFEFELILRRLEPLEPVVVFGLIEQEAGKFYNTAVVIDRGKLVTRYRKAHLIGREQAIFEAGSGCSLFEVSGTKIGINICYDLQFAESAESAVRAGAELLVCPCNNMLRLETAEEWKFRHNEIRCKRARDARVWILSSDVTGELNGRISYGPTAVIDSSGTVIAQVPLLSTGTRRARPHVRNAPSVVFE